MIQDSMMFGLKVLLLTSLAIAGIAYYVYSPFPDSAREPEAKTFGATLYRLFYIYVQVGEFLGLGTDPELHRTLEKSMFRLFDASTYDNVKVTVSEVDGVEVMILRPKDSSEKDSLPGLVYFHGGGWIVSDIHTYKPLTAQLAVEGHAVVISVNYRLAPENPFPVPFEDCLKVTKHVLRYGQKYGVDPTKVGIAGDSAGGNLAMAVGLYLGNHKDDGLPPLRTQGLFYPALQAFDFMLPSYLRHVNGPATLTKKLMVNFWMYYLLGNKDNYADFASNNHTSPELKMSRYAIYTDVENLPLSFQLNNLVYPDFDTGNQALSDQIKDTLLDYRFSPLMATNDELKNAPPTYLIACEFDPLRDDSFIGYERLRRARETLVEQRYYREEAHGFLGALDDVSIAALKEFIVFFRRTLKFTL